MKKCFIDEKEFKKILKLKNHIIINSLPKNDFDKDHIPDTLNLSSEILSKMNREKKILSFIKNNLHNYQSLHNLIKEKKLNIKDVPIIVYCQNSKSKSSEKLIDHLMNSGFTNVFEYSGGMDEWNKKNTFFNENLSENSELKDKYNLNIEKEKIVINNNVFNHNLKTEEIYDGD